jgi:hypothetical protein
MGFGQTHTLDLHGPDGRERNRRLFFKLTFAAAYQLRTLFFFHFLSLSLSLSVVVVVVVQRSSLLNVHEDRKQKTRAGNHVNGIDWYTCTLRVFHALIYLPNFDVRK